MNAFPLGRSVAVVAVALIVAAVLLHDAIAAMLVARGDGELAAGFPEGALRFYRRAAAISTNADAAERLSFADLEHGDPASLRDGLRVSARALAARPDEPALLLDRGLCALRLHEYATAYDAYRRAASLSHSPTVATLAGWSAFRAGRPALARAEWRTALRFDSRFAPARRALAQAHA